jgi:hypothetical protein
MSEEPQIIFTPIDTTNESDRLITPIAEQLFDEIDVDDETIAAISQAIAATFAAAARWVVSEHVAQLIEAGFDARITIEATP